MTPNEQQKAAALKDIPTTLTYGTAYDWMVTYSQEVRALLQPAPQQSEVEEAVEKITRELDLTHHMETVGTDMIHVSRDNLETLISAAQEAGRLREEKRKLYLTTNDAVEENTQLRTRIAELEKAQEWQPIESAPKPSGQLLLLAEGSVYNGHWYSPYSRWEYDCHFFPKTQPTHWLPLPQPPRIVPDKGEE